MDETSPAQEPPVARYELPLDEDARRGSSSDNTLGAVRDRALLRQNAVWFCRLRWIVVAVLVVAGVAAFFPDWLTLLGLHLAPEWLFTAALALALANWAYLAELARLPTPAPVARLRYLLWVQIVVDLVILTGVIHFLGSRATYAPCTYLFHIILACVFFRRGESLAVTAVAAALYLGCLLLENQGLHSADRPGLDAAAVVSVSVAGRGWLWNFATLLAIWCIIWYLVSRLASALRRREYELAAANRRLEASSEERARHMLQTTHQLKAPFAAIHANTQLLLGGYCGPLSPPAMAIVEKIAARAGMLSQQIQEMLQLANLRSSAQPTPRVTDIELAELITSIIARLEPTATLRSVRLEATLAPVRVCAVEDHLKMLLDNLLSNAVNYSFEGGVVQVYCGPGVGSTANLVVQDHGIGIPADRLADVFQDYYRTKEAAHHNRSSTGLGLAVVRHVARSLRAAVTLESGPGWGTRFTVQLPLA